MISMILKLPIEIRMRLKANVIIKNGFLMVSLIKHKYNLSSYSESAFKALFRISPSSFWRIGNILTEGSIPEYFYHHGRYFF
jgi:hypothetical protein